MSDAHLLNGELRGLVELVVHEAVALGLASGVQGDLAAQDGAEGGEGVVQRLVVDGLVQVLHAWGLISDTDHRPCLAEMDP